MSTPRNLIQNDELERAAELLLALARSRESDGLLQSEYVHRAINAAARLAALRRDSNDAVITHEQAQVERSRIRKSLLALLDEIEAFSPLPSSSLADLSPFAQAPESTAQEAIFGTPQLRSVGWLRRGLDLARAVCRIRVSKGGVEFVLGTGFHIGKGRILTNHHVLSSMDEANGAEIRFDYEEDSSGGVLPGKRYRTLPNSWRSSQAFDCAVVQLDAPNMDETWGKLTLEAQQSPRRGDHVTIIQHPEGGPKQIAMTANQVRAIHQHHLFYSTDTLPGSSGSPVFDNQWRVVALHAGAQPNELKLKSGERFFANKGILIRYVIEALGLGE